MYGDNQTQHWHTDADEKMSHCIWKPIFMWIIQRFIEYRQCVGVPKVTWELLMDRAEPLLFGLSHSRSFMHHAILAFVRCLTNYEVPQTSVTKRWNLTNPCCIKQMFRVAAHCCEINHIERNKEQIKQAGEMPHIPWSVPEISAMDLAAVHTTWNRPSKPPQEGTKTESLYKPGTYTWYGWLTPTSISAAAK